MSEDDLKAKIEFVEKMKRENPRAFEFLGRGATDLLEKIKLDQKRKNELSKKEIPKFERSKTE